MFYINNIKYKILYILAATKICTCQSSTLTPEETANGEVTYKLYNGNSKDGIVIKSTDKEYLYKVFEPGLSCIFVTHGWTRNADTPSVMLPTNALRKCHAKNVITVDWRKIASNPFYLTAADNTIQVGEAVRQMMIKLDRLGFCILEEIYAIGHSLGAHIMGIAGNRLRDHNGRQLKRITGEDPAGPGFENGVKPRRDRLNEDSAGFVDVIHTDDKAGSQERRGQVDFMPNGGRGPQPGCDDKNVTQEYCSHIRAFEYLAESICSKTAFPSVYCGSYDYFKKKRCDGNPVVRMGYYSVVDYKRLKAQQGYYYLDTNDKSPFSQY